MSARWLSTTCGDASLDGNIRSTTSVRNVKGAHWIIPIIHNVISLRLIPRTAKLLSGEITLRNNADAKRKFAQYFFKSHKQSASYHWCHLIALVWRPLERIAQQQARAHSDGQRRHGERRVSAFGVLAAVAAVAVAATRRTLPRDGWPTDGGPLTRERRERSQAIAALSAGRGARGHLRAAPAFTARARVVASNTIVALTTLCIRLCARSVPPCTCTVADDASSSSPSNEHATDGGARGRRANCRAALRQRRRNARAAPRKSLDRVARRRRPQSWPVLWTGAAAHCPTQLGLEAVSLLAPLARLRVERRRATRLHTVAYEGPN